MIVSPERSLTTHSTLVCAGESRRGVIDTQAFQTWTRGPWRISRLVKARGARHLASTIRTSGNAMAVLKLDRWNIAIGDGQPLVVIAGLNVLEDEGLALETAR